MEEQIGTPERRLEPVAGWWHTATVLLILGYFSFRFALSRHGDNPPGAGGVATSEASQLWGYVFLIGSEFALASWMWAGVHWKGLNIRDIVGGRWNSWRSVAHDFAIALPFWLVWEATAWLVHRAVDPLHAEVAPYHVPTGFTEVFLWILLSVSAGLCEEFVYRGYLQRQFQAATGSVAAGVILQGLVFGLGHTYQGWGQVTVITALGILYCALVAWRRDLRASMIAHAWGDIYEGYLQFLSLPHF